MCGPDSGLPVHTTQKRKFLYLPTEVFLLAGAKFREGRGKVLGKWEQVLSIWGQEDKKHWCLAFRNPDGDPERPLEGVGGHVDSKSL
jgi:hypothetical protein